MEQENELGTKSKEATDLETKPLPSKPDEDKSEHMKEAAIEQKLKVRTKLGKPGIQRLH